MSYSRTKRNDVTSFALPPCLHSTLQNIAYQGTGRYLSMGAYAIYPLGASVPNLAVQFLPKAKLRTYNYNSIVFPFLLYLQEPDEKADNEEGIW